MPRRVASWLWASVLLVGLNPALAAPPEISGAGSTFVYPVLAKWAEAYKAGRGVTVKYQSVGSGAGIKLIESKAIDFGASDAPLSPAELDRYGLLQFPIVIGGDVPVVNLPGIEPGKLKLTGPVLADIYLGKIAQWNDKAIAKLNPDLPLPDREISVIHRSDGSGTTYIWLDYLSKVSEEFKNKVGVGTSVDWHLGQGGQGNEGVAALVAKTPGAIGYVEFAYAKSNSMTFAQVQNKDGMFISPDKTSFKIAAANAEWSQAPAFSLMLTDQPGNGSWPITGSTFILMYKAQPDAEKAKLALQFFFWAYTYGQPFADSLDYVPMPASVARLVEASWSDIKGADNRRLWAGK